MRDRPDSAAELRTRALRLLARREHSRRELERKLSPHAGSADDLRNLVSELATKNQLSEARFAEERARRLARKYGVARIRQDLKAKGVPEDLVARFATTSEELERARAILERKYRAPATTREERARRMRFLQQRGFSSEIISSLLSARDAA
ncbi:MAG TPA: recombination regulator RecX [Burkholderiales bacterium]|nr:recombination regulator RecX [Burkholderiales bacterium]